MGSPAESAVPSTAQVKFIAGRQCSAITRGVPQTHSTIPVKTSLFASLMLLAHFTAFGQDALITPERISLWANHAPIGGGEFEPAEATITVHRAAKPNGAAFVICPCGGYGKLMRIAPSRHPSGITITSSRTPATYGSR